MVSMKAFPISLSVFIALGSTVTTAQTNDGFFTKAFPKNEVKSTASSAVLAGEALWFFSALIAGIAGVGNANETNAMTIFKQESEALLKARYALTSDVEREKQIGDLMTDAKNFQYDKKSKSMMLTAEAQRALEDLRQAPIITAESKAAIVDAAEAKWNRSNDDLVKALNSRGFKFGRFFVVGGLIAGLDATTQIVLVMTTDHYGKISPMAAMPVQAVQALTGVLPLQAAE